MNNKTVKLLLSLVRSAISGSPLTQEEKALYSDDILPELIKLADQQDLCHLACLSLKNNSLAQGFDLKSEVIRAVYRYENQNRDCEEVYAVLEKEKIPFIVLKGAVIRSLYPEKWMRTSCDTDILIHYEDLDRAVEYFIKNSGFTVLERTTHDVTMRTPNRNNIEFHFDLVEEGIANNAISILKSVWETAEPIKENGYALKMKDELFYFFHIAHMAKHVENGGCGIKPLMDLWLIDEAGKQNKENRDKLLQKGRLLKFADVMRNLSEVWFKGKPADQLSVKLEQYIISGRLYGTAANRVAIGQEKAGGKTGYLISRIFAPYDRLKRYYPILQKHKWLTPIMQIRRWFMLFRPEVAKMAKGELKANNSLSQAKAQEMHSLLRELGL